MLIVEIVLEGETLENMEVVAGVLGVSLEVAVVMACQHYVRWINKHGFPRLTGLYLRGEDGDAELGLGGPRGNGADGETKGV